MPSPVSSRPNNLPPLSSPTPLLAFKNHQNWQISLSQDPETRAPLFEAIDPHGLVHTLKEFIVEAVDPAEVQQQGIVSYLLGRFQAATPFQVHIEKTNSATPFIRFGGYGIQGGLPKWAAYASSSAQVIAGGVLCATGVGGIAGGILISSGLSGGLSTFNSDSETVAFGEYLKQTGYGVISGAVSGGVGTLGSGGSAAAKFGYQVLSGVAGNASSQTVSTFVDKGRLPTAKELGTQAIISGVSGGLGAGAGKLAGGVVGKQAGTAAKVAKAALKGAASSGTSKATANVMEGKDLTDDLLQSAFVGGALAGGIKGAKKAKLARDEWVREAKALATKTETEVGDLKAKAAATESEIPEAQKEAQRAQESAAAAQKETTPVESEYKQAEARHAALTQEYEARLARIREHVVQQQKNGIRAKIGKDGPYYSSPDDIAKRLIAGEKVTWEKGPGATGKGRLGTEGRVPERLIDEIASARARLDQTKAAFDAKQSAAQQAQAKAAAAAADVGAKQSQADSFTQQAEQRAVDLDILKTFIRGENELPIFSAPDASDRVSDRLGPGPTVSKVDAIDYARTDCTKAELIEHVVLVHAIVPDGIFSNLTEEQLARFDYARASDQNYITAFCLKEALGSDGTIGSHYDLERREYQGGLVSRPHLHWCWNQLVPANSGGAWENAQIALFEPLSTFEKSSSEKPFCMAPYDTFTIGAHRLSKDAIILVPEGIVDEVRAHLTDFEGNVVGYPPGGKSMRVHIMDAIDQHYPDTWHMCDEEGGLVGNKDQSRDPGYDAAAGYRKKTCVKTRDGKVIPLIQGEGLQGPDQISIAFQELGKAKRFIGLHYHSPTDRFEKDIALDILDRFKRNPSIAVDRPEFAGQIKTPAALGQMVSLTTFEVYQQLLAFDPETRATAAADYYINEAIFGDIVSIYCAKNSTRDFPLSTLELKMIISSARPFLINLLENIHQLAHSGNLGEAFRLFKAYCKLLAECLQDHRRAIEQLAQLTSAPDAAASAAAMQLPLKVAQDEWEKVKIPADTAFDLRTSWPLTGALHTFVNKVLRALPKEPKSQIQLYQELRALSPRGPKEQYRINIILNLLEWVYLEQTYSTLRGDEGTSVLAGKLSIMDEALAAQYGLVTEDFTLTVGDCLFDNVLRQTDSPLSAQVLRTQTVLFMQRHPADYQSYFDFSTTNTLKKAIGSDEDDIQYQSWEQYLDGMGKPLVWATEVEIQALSELLDRPIILFAPRERPKFYNRESIKDPILLYHKNQNHFVSCVPLKGLTPRDLLPVIENP